MSVDTPQNIINNFPVTLYAIRSSNIYKLLREFRADPAVESCYAFGEYLHVTLKDHHNGDEFLKELAHKYQAEGFEAKRITATIEDSFIRLMREQGSGQLTIDS